MFKKTRPSMKLAEITQFPHCDQRILHAPRECEHCDHYPQWQFLRIQWGIAFTGYEPENKELPCPADHARGDNHTKWQGNVARPIHNHLGGKNVAGCAACFEEGGMRL